MKTIYYKKIKLLLNTFNQKKMTEDKKDYGLMTYVSVGFGQCLIEFLLAAFGTRVYDFYENEIGLATGLISLALILYAIWNMFNDPIVGYLADRPHGFWKKYGKRFLWILAGGLPWAFIFILFFATPNIDPITDALPLFFYLLLILCLYDTLFSIYDVNFNSLIPDKFRTDKQRIKQSSFAVALGLTGTVLGATIPPLLIDYGNKSTFFIMSIVVAFMGFGFLLLTLFGVRETEDMKIRAVEVDAKIERENFFKIMRSVLKQKSFVAYLCIFTLYQSMVLLMTGSVPYVVRFILNEEAETESLIMLGYIVVGLLSIPMWSKISQKVNNNKKMFVIGGALLTVLAIPFLFVNTVITVMLSVAFWAIGSIGFWVFMLPVLGDCVDEAALRLGRREEGIYMGVRTFFGRIAIIIQASTFAIIHIATGFEPGSPTQTPIAILGLRFQVALIPMILMLIGVVLFWKLYDITPEKKVETRKKLEELKL